MSLNALRPALFIDKDGTLVQNVPYNVDPARLRFMPGALDALRRIAGRGFALVVVTNQSGIARGFFSAADFEVLRQALERRLFEEAGLRLQGLEMCPHAPRENGEPACRCRKPAPGLLLRAARAHGIDLARSWIVGDTLDDVEAGHRSGCRAVLLHSGGETVWKPGPLREPEAIVADWPSFCDFLERQPASPRQAGHQR